MSATFSIDPSSIYGGVLVPVSSGWQHSAVSGEAKAVERDTREVDHTLEHSEALFRIKKEAISELRSIALECGVENWDDEGANPIEPWAVRTAERFIRVLPEGIPMPEVTPEPDGSIGLDWSVSSSRVFSVSFGSGLRLACAWLDGTDRGHAVTRFDGETIPHLILGGVRALFRNT